MFKVLGLSPGSGSVKFHPMWWFVVHTKQWATFLKSCVKLNCGLLHYSVGLKCGDVRVSDFTFWVKKRISINLSGVHFTMWTLVHSISFEKNAIGLFLLVKFGSLLNGTPNEIFILKFKVV